MLPMVELGILSIQLFRKIVKIKVQLQKVGDQYHITACFYKLLLLIIYKPSKVTIMKKNMGVADKLIRILLAIIVGFLYYNNVISGTLAIVLGVLAGIFMLTSLIGFCPLYVPLGINTCKSNK